MIKDNEGVKAAVIHEHLFKPIFVLLLLEEGTVVHSEEDPDYDKLQLVANLWVSDKTNATIH